MLGAFGICASMQARCARYTELTGGAKISIGSILRIGSILPDGRVYFLLGRIRDLKRGRKDVCQLSLTHALHMSIDVS